MTAAQTAALPVGSSCAVCPEHVEQVEFLQKPLALLLGFFRRRSLFDRQVKLQIHQQLCFVHTEQALFLTLSHIPALRAGKTNS